MKRELSPLFEVRVSQLRAQIQPSKHSTRNKIRTGAKLGFREPPQLDIKKQRNRNYSSSNSHRVKRLAP